MIDILLEIIRAGVLGILLCYLLWVGKKGKFFQQKGWSYVVVGSLLVFFGSAIDITDNFPSLNAYVIIGDTPSEAFLEKVVGSLLGFALIFLGFWHWLPWVSSNKLEALESDLKYKTLMNQSPDFLFVSRIDDLRFTEVNDRACEHYGYSREEFLSKSILDVEVEPATHQEVRALYDRMPVGQVVEVYGTNKRKDASAFPVHVRFTKLDETHAIANVRDITQQKRAEDALRDSEQRLASLIELAADAIVIVDESQRISGFNSCATDVFGYRKEEVIGKNLDILLPPRFKGAHQQHVQDFSLEEGELRRMGAERLVFGRRKVGSEFPMEASIEKIIQGSEITFIAVLRDISERDFREKARLQEAVSLAREEELVDSRRRVMTMSEGLRRDIAQQLHGTVQSKLIVVQQMIGQMAEKSGVESKKNAFSKIDTIMADLIQNDVRRIGQQLYPAMLRRGLMPALFSLISRMELALNVEEQFAKNIQSREAAERDFIPLASRLVAYRIAEEALTNVIKHSEAKAATIRLELQGEEQLRLTVRDEGVGFDSQSESASLGLAAMQDYAEVAGGKCEIRSSLGTGTEVIALLPLRVESLERIQASFR